MAALQTRIFTGATAEEATDALWIAINDGSLWIAINDGSFRVVLIEGTVHPVAMWVTHCPVPPAMMQQASYELHCTAWVEM